MTVHLIKPDEWPSHDGGPPFRAVGFGDIPCVHCDCPYTVGPPPADCDCRCHEGARFLDVPLWRRETHDA